MKQKIAMAFILCFLFLLIVLPLCVVFLLSIVRRWSTTFPSSFSLEWWERILEPKYLRVISNTFLVTGVSTFLTVGYGIVSAYLFTFYEFKGKKVLSALILSPTYVAGVVLALGLLTIYPMLRNSFWILMLGHFVIISPIIFKFVYSSMFKISKNLVEASYSLGSSKLYTFRRIVFPLCRKGIISGTVISVGMNISELGVSLLLYGAGWATIPIQIYLERGWGILGVAGVLSTILVVISLLTIFSVNRWSQ